jgi:hypothetical protein
MATSVQDEAPVDLRAVVSRRTLDDAPEAMSGARLEKVVLRDGGRFVLKHLPPEGDWLTRVTSGAGRIRRLWETGVLARVEHVVDHTVVDVTLEDGHDIVVMRDASTELFPADAPLTRERSRQALAGLAGFHHGWTGAPVDGFCTLGARYRLFDPAFHAADLLPNPHPRAVPFIAAWESFAEHGPADVVEAVAAVHRDPDRLGGRLAAFPPTLLHGDPKLPNLGLGPGGLVAVDWGELTGFGPPEVDVAWYAGRNASRVGGSPGDVFDDYVAGGGKLDPEALDLACIGAMAQVFFLPSLMPGVGEVAAQHDWWVARCQSALERVGTV